MDTVERTTPADTATFDAFISYSHAADDLLAPRLQSALQRFAKPWWKRRALRVFRDESSLSANPHLWSSITEALDESDWFVLLLSPDAAQSPWVNQEIEYWIEHKNPSRILPVVTDGDFGWDGDVTGHAAPETLQGVFSEEPRWVDLRFAHGEEQLDLKNPRFSAAVADIASALRGVPKDELESEEVKQHRRTIRTAWAAAFLVLLLSVASVVAAIQSSRNAAEAERQAEIAAQNEATAVAEAQRADANAAEAEESATEAEQAAQLAKVRELASASIANLESNPELSVLLGVHAFQSAPAGDEWPPEARIALRQAVHSSYIERRYPTGLEQIVLGDVSEDGSLLIATKGSSVSLFRIDPWLPIWTLEWADLGLESQIEGCFGEAWFLSDSEIVIGFIDEEARDCANGEEPDREVMTGLAIVNTDDGSVLRSRLFGPCPASLAGPASPDGEWLVVVVGAEQACQQEGAVWSMQILDVLSLDTVKTFDVSSIGNPSWSGDGRRISHTSFHGQGARVFDVDSGRMLTDLDEGVFFGQLNHDGSLLATSDVGTTVILYDVENGHQVDRLSELGDAPFWLDFSSDGSLLFAGGNGAATAVWNALDGRLRALLPNTGPVSVLDYHEPTETLYHLGKQDLTTWDLSGGVEGSRNTADLETWVQGNSVVSRGSRGVLLGMLQDHEWGPHLRVFDATTGVIGDAVLDVEMGRAPALLPDGRVVAWPAERRGDDSTMGPVVVWSPETGETVPLVGCPVRIDQALEDPDTITCVREGEFFNFDRTLSWGSSRFAVTSHASPNQPAKVLVFNGHNLELVDELEAPPTVESVEEIGEGWMVGSNLRTGITSDAKELTLYRTDSWDSLASVPASISQPSHGGDLIAIPVTGGGVVVLDTISGATLAELDGSSARVRGLAFSPDDSLLMTSATDGFVRIWDLSTEREVERIPLDDDSGDGVWLDGETIAIGTQNGLWTNISINPDDLLDLALGRLQRSLREVECERYRIDPCPTLEEMRED